MPSAADMTSAQVNNFIYNKISCVHLLVSPVLFFKKIIRNTHGLNKYWYLIVNNTQDFRKSDFVKLKKK